MESAQVPALGIVVEEHVVTAIHDYEMPGKGFLPLHAGDVIFITEEDASGWWLGVNALGKKGVLPSTYTVPYAFPQPPNDLHRELRLLRVAQRYGIDMSSGAPVPQAKGEPLMAANEPGAAASVASLEELYRRVDSAILQRESQRSELALRLRQLRDAEANRSLLTGQQAVAETSTLMDAKEQQRTLVGLRESLRRMLDDALEETCKDGITVQPRSSEWYETMSAALSLLGEEVLVQNVRALQVRATQSAVRRQEDSLEQFAEEVKDSEEAYQREKKELLRRIQTRDARVTVALEWWAAQAEADREAYLEEKASALRGQEVSRQKLASLRATLEKKRTEFHECVTDLEAQREKARLLKQSLQGQTELHALDEEIKELSTETARLLLEAKKRKRRST